jgi:hypothetical protein
MKLSPYVVSDVEIAVFFKATKDYMDWIKGSKKWNFTWLMS